MDADGAPWPATRVSSTSRDRAQSVWRVARARREAGEGEGVTDRDDRVSDRPLTRSDLVLFLNVLEEAYREFTGRAMASQRLDFTVVSREIRRRLLERWAAEDRQ